MIQNPPDILVIMEIDVRSRISAIVGKNIARVPVNRNKLHDSFEGDKLYHFMRRPVDIVRVCYMNR